MATKVFMEALSPTMEEGRLVKWLKNEGDAVKSGEPLAEVETDKAIMELVARGDGVLRKRLVGEGESRPVGQLVAVIAAAGENIDSLVAEAGAAGSAAGQPDSRTAAQPEPAGRPDSQAAGPQQPERPQPTAAPASSSRPAVEPSVRQAPAAQAPAGNGGQLRSSPLARR